jgi:phenylacetate-CoA ligase
MAMLALQYQFERSERLPPERIIARQFRQLALLTEHAARAIPFHRARLRAAGIGAGKPFDAATWARLAPMTRRDLQREGAALRAATPSSHGAVTLKRSSGSSGMPIDAASTALAGMFSEAVAVRDHLWHGRDFTGSVASIRRPRGAEQSGARSAVWTRGTSAAFATGGSALLDSMRPVSEQLDWLLGESPDYLVTYPSNLRALVGEAARRGCRPGSIKAVLTQGEAVPPDLATRLRDAWGAALQDCYSASETGVIALQCPHSGLYHIQSEVALVEVLGSEGRPCLPGETGRVAVTPLHNFAQPLLRYDIGDLAEVAGPCACGRTLPTLARIVGRTTGMLVLPDGALMRPYFHAAIAEAGLPIRQFQIVQRARDSIEARLAVERPLSAAEEEALRARLRAAARADFAITFTYHAEIARGPGGKFEDFASKVANGA